MTAIISYVLSVIATVLGLIEPFNKKMSMVLIFSLLGNVLVGISYALSGTGAQTGALICGVACVQLIINYFLKTKNREVPSWLIVIYALIFIGVNLIGGIKYWFDIIALLAALCFVFGYSQVKTKYYRLLFVLNSGLWIAYDILAESYGNLFTHAALFIATVIAMFILDGKNKKRN